MTSAAMNAKKATRGRALVVDPKAGAARVVGAH
jgi:hypothetical protein